MGSLIEGDLTFRVLGAAHHVHRTLGCGFLERVYQEALALTLQKHGIPFRREAELPIHFEGTRLACGYRVDFLCFDAIIVEVKATEHWGPNDSAQLLNYLKAGNFRIGLLVNFGGTRLQIKRMVN